MIDLPASFGPVREQPDGTVTLTKEQAVKLMAMGARKIDRLEEEVVTLLPIAEHAAMMIERFEHWLIAQPNGSPVVPRPQMDELRERVRKWKAWTSGGHLTPSKPADASVDTDGTGQASG